MHRTSTDSRTASENSQKTQQGSLGGKGEEIESEGFWKMFHHAEERFYGPNGLGSSKDKVFRCLLHSELRWPAGHEQGLPKTKQQISKITGLTIKQIEHASIQLQKGKWIDIISGLKINGVIQPSTYRVTREIAEMYRVPKKWEPTIIQGGVSRNPEEGSPEIREGVSRNPGGKLSDLHLKSDTYDDLNKGFKEQCLNTTKTETVVDENGLSKQKAKEIILSRFPDDGPRYEAAFTQINRDRKYKKTDVSRPAGFICKGWEFIRDDFSFADAAARQENKVATKKEEKPIDQLAADLARDAVMKMYWKKNR